ncbi:formate/nitrite transporter family protein [Rarobacter incanus]|uniref:Nitrite transporter NirC n=1 Tax=Rarobacter incanus TaxID=153494 RepID=A0A542SP73_9MICO|nr:formate/nitrite transporter family protein [Rarobacter incanus]TQK76424.1 nitrite transporter NirC [Rarobacter incanus]
MLNLVETLELQDYNATKKANGIAAPWRFLVQAMLAGAYIGVGVIIMVTAAGPLLANGSGWAKMVSGLVFPVALTLVVVAGGELVTSSMMTLTQGWARRAIDGKQWGMTLGFTFLANFAGAWVFSVFVWMSKVAGPETPGGQMLESMLKAKAHESGYEMFGRGVLCNVLVCLAIWSVARLKSETAQLIVVFWCIMAFITSGFEHVVANMTTYAVGMLSGYEGATVGHYATNMLYVGLGNLVGGAMVGLAYVSSTKRKEKIKDEAAPAA